MQRSTCLTIVAALVAAIAVLTVGVAAAALSSTRTAAQHLRAASIPAPATPSASSSGSTVTLTFPSITLSGGRPLAFEAARLDAAGSTVLATVPCATISGGCTVSGAPAGTWRFQVRGVYATWTGAFSGTSTTVTVTAPTSLTLDVAFARQNKNFATVGFSGAGNTAGTSLTVTVYTASTCAGSAVSFSTIPASTGSWAMPAANLADNTQYAARATQGTDQSPCITFSIPDYP